MESTDKSVGGDPLDTEPGEFGPLAHGPGPLDDLRHAFLRDLDQLHGSPGDRAAQANPARIGMMNEISYGQVVVAFQVAYALGLLIAGRVVDKIGTGSATS